MRKFAHLNATSVEEAVAFLRRYHGRAKIIAGGTDLLGQMKDEIGPDYPEALVNIKTIPGLDFISVSPDGLRLGALARLEDIARHPVLNRDYNALAAAAHRTASPHIREMGTLGGNVCQDIRCWYYRKARNRFPCLRKGGGRCYAIEGDNRYHSIFGPSVTGGCLAVHPSDTAPALIALDARVRTSRRTIALEDLFTVGVSATTVLEGDEIVLDFVIPRPAAGAKSAFTKFALRKTIDFPIINCAASIVTSESDRIGQARVCLNAVFVKPLRAVRAEESLVGQALDRDAADRAGREAVRNAKPVRHNAYLVSVARAAVERTVLACAD